jgi:hypothetical protein
MALKDNVAERPTPSPQQTISHASAARLWGTSDGLGIAVPTDEGQNLRATLLRHRRDALPTLACPAHVHDAALLVHRHVKTLPALDPV